MQDYNTIIGVITMRQNDCSFSVIQARYHIGSGTAQRILNRFGDSGFTLEQLKAMEPRKVEELIFPPTNLRRKNTPMPDFQYYYDRIHAKGSKVNIAYCWLEYKQQYPDGYEQSQFYEYYNRFVEQNFGKRDAKMAVERIPGEKLYIDWVGDQPELLTNPETGETIKVHIFATTLGLSSLIYAEAFLDEKLPRFIAGTVNAIQFYGGITKYLIPDNLKTAITKHTKDELILQSAYSDLEDFYDTIVLPPPPRKPKGKPTVENHVKYLETHLVEKLKEKIYVSLDELNADIKKIVATLNSRKFQGKDVSRRDVFEKYDRPCLKPLPGGDFTVCDYKPVTRIPDNYHIEYDGHYYSVLYSYCGKPAILKALPSEIRICDQYNRLICKHKRSYESFPLYVTDDSHMRPEHLYYKEVNEKDGAYYRRWAAVFGPHMSEFIDRLLKAPKHEEQAYNSCAGILHHVKDLPHGIVEEAARQCIQMSSCRYKTYKQVLARIQSGSGQVNQDTLPTHDNIRGKGFYKYGALMAYRQKNYTYNDKLSKEENLLLDHLFKIKASHMAAELERQFLDPNSELEDFHTRITKLINHEWDQRQAAKFNKLLKKATLKYPAADFDETIYEPDRLLDTHTIELLQKCTWIDEPKNLLITGSTGAGKTYLANALCVTALRQMRSVKYIRANTLLQETEKARMNGTSLEYINEMASYDLLVIDDFGLMELSLDKCSDLFEIIETRDTRKSTVIASQIPVIRWWDMFKDNTYADACLSRITSKAYRLECNGRDMRQAK